MADQFLYDGSNTFIGGQDASTVPAQVQANAYYAGINTQVTNGVFQPRWGLAKRQIIFPSGGITVLNTLNFISYEEIFHSGRFQCCLEYTYGGVNYLIFVVSGIIYFVNSATLVAQILTIQGGGTLNENTPRLNHVAAGRFAVIFDFPNFPVIIEGNTARRANPALYEIPVSVNGVYNQNRLFISNAGNEYTAGDPTGSLATPNAPITFEEVEAPAAAFLGQIFALPTDKSEPITAMASLQLIDTSTGIGPLLIGTRNAIYSVQAQTPRTNWESSTFASAFVLNAGIAGAHAFVNVNSDLFFLSPDGQVRSASMSRDEQKQWSRVPVSREVSNWLKYWDPTLTTFATMGYFKNKIFITVNPFRTKAFNTQRQPIFDVAHGGFIVLSLDNVATLGHTGAPAWDGLWTGVRPMELITNDKQFFVISKDAAFRNELYEFLPESTIDIDGNDYRYIKTTVYTREYDFNSPFQNKDAHSMDLGLRNVAGDFKMDVKYKPSQGANFALWQHFDHCAPWRECGTLLKILNGYAQHSFMDLNLGSPAETQACDPVSQRLYSTFRRVQLKFIMEGKYWELWDYRLKAIASTQSEQENLSCQNKECVAVAKDCNEDWAIGPFRSCQTHQT